MNDQQEYVLANLRDEMDAKEARLNIVQAELSRTKEALDFANDLHASWLDESDKDWQKIGLCFTIGLAIGWWFL